MSSISASHLSRFVVYNGHAGLGANLVDRESSEIVTDNKDPDVAARAEEAVSECLPEVEDEVLVTFDHGDPRRPCFIASLWNCGDKPSEVSR